MRPLYQKMGDAMLIIHGDYADCVICRAIKTSLGEQFWQYNENINERNGRYYYYYRVHKSLSAIEDFDLFVAQTRFTVSNAVALLGAAHL